jgi:hypothetical protein
MKHLKLFENFINEGRVKKDEKIDIYRDDRYIIVEPLTHRASCKYGAYTNWCTSTPSDDFGWNTGVDANLRKIIIIDKKFEENTEKVNTLSDIVWKVENGELDLEDYENEEVELLRDILMEKEYYDLSKIALTVNEDNEIVQVWDARNTELTQFIDELGLSLYGDAMDIIDLSSNAYNAINEYLSS